MAHHNTILGQMLKMIPRHEFEVLANTYHCGRKFRSASRWSQFVAMAIAQLTGRLSLRDTIAGIKTQRHRLYHLGVSVLSRSNLSRINENKPYALYEALFGKLLKRCQSMAPRHGFRFKNKLVSLDATTIDLCLSVFPWAEFRATKGAVKLHVGMDHSGYLPSFVHITPGKIHEIEIARQMQLPKGSIVTMDRGFTDYQWYQHLTNKKVHFVTRVKKNAKYQVIERKTVSRTQGITSDQIIRLNGTKAAHCPTPLRRVGFKDPVTKIHYAFLTNNFKLSAKTIAQIYKSRWQIELFFKWIKQNLKIKAFLGTSKNAVLTQIWIAMCVYLLLAFLKFQSQTASSLQKLLRQLQLNLFEKRDLFALLRGDPPPGLPIDEKQMVLL